MKIFGGSQYLGFAGVNGGEFMALKTCGNLHKGVGLGITEITIL
jgi:hypothetical protein